MQRREKRHSKTQRLGEKREANEWKRVLEDHRADSPLPKSATEVLRREAQWTTRYINTKRTGHACRLVNREAAAEFDLVRRSRPRSRGCNATIRNGLEAGRFRASGVLFYPLAFVTG